jgi:hypothetical protein
MLAGWWGSFGLLGESGWIGPIALTGLALGLALDVTALRRRLGSLFELPMPALFGVATFYSVMIYGAFMGFPVVNAFVGIAGGYVVGRRAVLASELPEQARREARAVASFATGVLFALCCATAWLALREPTLPTELRHMFSLPFTPTESMIYVLIVAGGLGLVAAEYGATLATARWAVRQGASAAERYGSLGR